jgi:hypothetical protein
MSSEESERILTPQLSAHMFALAGRRQIQFGDGFRRLLTNEWRRRGDWGGGGIPTCASRKVKLRGIPKRQVMKLYRIMSQKFV